MDVTRKRVGSDLLLLKNFKKYELDKIRDRRTRHEQMQRSEIVPATFEFSLHREDNVDGSATSFRGHLENWRQFTIFQAPCPAKWNHDATTLSNLPIFLYN